MARVRLTDPIQINDTPANIVMLQQMCYLHTNNAAHPYSVSDIINYPMPRPHTRGHRGRLRSEATSSRTKDNRLIPAGEDHISRQARLTDGSNATPTLPPKSKISKAASCKQRRPQRQPKASSKPLTQFGGKTHPGDEASRRPYKYQGKPEKRG